MRRVYIIFILRRVLSPFGVKGMLAVMLALVSSFVVSVPSIIANTFAHETLTELIRYVAIALTETSLIMKVIVLALAVCFVLMVYDIVRMVRERKDMSALPSAS